MNLKALSKALRIKFVAVQVPDSVDRPPDLDPYMEDPIVTFERIMEDFRLPEEDLENSSGRLCTAPWLAALWINWQLMSFLL